LIGSGVIVLGPLILGVLTFALFIDRSAPGFFDVEPKTVIARFDAVRAVLISEIGEDPNLTPQPTRGTLPLCDDVAPVFGQAFRLAFGLMRGTDEGQRLYDQLVDQGICIRVRELPYNTAYASSRSVRGDWSSSTVVIDQDYVRSVQADVLAAVLMHESTHIDRAISGEACYFQRASDLGNTCTTLPNGVTVEEEVAAHSAEATWWIAAYGDNGKRFALSTDYAENQLAKAYLQGASFFRTYVIDIRSDTREGEGF